MKFHADPEPITDSDEAIAAALADIPIPPLLTTVAHLTGDHSLLADDLWPNLEAAMLPNLGYGADLMAKARALATQALARYRDAGSPPPAPLDDLTARRFVDFVNGGAPIPTTSHSSSRSWRSGATIAAPRSGASTTSPPAGSCGPP